MRRPADGKLLSSRVQLKQIRRAPHFEPLGARSATVAVEAHPVVPRSKSFSVAEWSLPVRFCPWLLSRSSVRRMANWISAGDAPLTAAEPLDLTTALLALAPV